MVPSRNTQWRMRSERRAWGRTGRREPGGNSFWHLAWDLENRKVYRKHLEILGSRSSLVFEREPLWALKDSSLRIQDLALAARAARLAAMAMVPWCWLFLPTRQELRAMCLELVQGQVVQAARRNSWMSFSALIRLVN